ncbi:MAG: hypothetical protein JZU52_12585 [Lamprocystis purpurea]|jgi:hypothetical protein|uniref:hypothetical protein n=1 Tax=Lamprocystis purpurea TaxID=61598 RepID=UPI0003641C71|nr:hypothetical protein [Lamprocystis purpurea]MBV5274432.1 hypothetical protein [Lamprocystis purpurea]
MNRMPRWTPQEDAVLIALSAGAPLTERTAKTAMLAAGYDRTGKAIMARARQINIPTKSSGDPWTPAEDALLRAVLATGASPFGPAIVAALAAAGVHRTIKAIGARYYRLAWMDAHGQPTRPARPAPAAPAQPPSRAATLARDFRLITAVINRVFVPQVHTGEAAA